MECSTDKLDRYNEREIYRMLSVIQTVENHVTSTCLSVSCLK
jgi:hypothetical protein